MRSLNEIVEILVDVLKPYCHLPYATFGHSMGALLAFELSRSLGHHCMLPERVFVAGRGAPQLPLSEQLHNLDDDVFVQRIRSLQGTSEDTLQNQDLMELLIPMMKADFAVAETYAYAPTPAVQFPITVIGGENDKDVSRDDMQAWQEVTTKPISMRMAPGGHFFVNEQTELICRFILDLLEDRYRV